MQEMITFSYTDGSMTICLDEFFPCAMERLDKLLDAVADTWDLEAAQATRAKMAAHCQDRARDLEEKLPGLQRMADGAMTSVRIAEKQLRETQARVRELSASFQLLDGAPVFIDWTDRERFLEDLEADLAALVSGGGEDPDLLTGEERDELFYRIEGDAAVCWAEEIPVGLLHGDLKGDNLLVSGPGGSGVKVIDWQRPMRAPLPLEEELSLLLTRPEIPSSGPFHRLACAAEVHWYAWAWRTCLPWPFVRMTAVKYARMCLRG